MSIISIHSAYDILIPMSNTSNNIQPPEILQQSPAGTTTQTAAVTQEDPGQLLGIIGLVVGVAAGMSLIGFILCYLGNKKAKEAGVKSTICVVGMWVNGVLMALALIFFVLFLFSLASRLSISSSS
jgi:hypothetical protein